MIEFSTLELVLLVANIVSLAMYFRSDDRRQAAEWFIKQLIENEKVRIKVLSDFEEFKKERGV